MNPNSKMSVYRMAWAKCGLMALSGAIIAWTTSMSGVQWETLAGTERIGVILGCVGAAITVIIAFLDRTISKIEAEQEVIPGTPENVAKTGNTEFVAKPPVLLQSRSRETPHSAPSQSGGHAG